MMNSEPFFLGQEKTEEPTPQTSLFSHLFGGDPHMKKNVEGDEEEPKRLEERRGERERLMFFLVWEPKRKRNFFFFYPKRLFFSFSCFAPGEMMMVACDRRTCSSLLDRVLLFL